MNYGDLTLEQKKLMMEEAASVAIEKLVEQERKNIGKFKSYRQIQIDRILGVPECEVVFDVPEKYLERK